MHARLAAALRRAAALLLLLLLLSVGWGRLVCRRQQPRQLGLERVALPLQRLHARHHPPCQPLHLGAQLGQQPLRKRVQLSLRGAARVKGRWM